MAPPNAGNIGFVNLALLAASIALSYYAASAIYNVFFHPLRSFPGPLANRFSALPRLYQNLRGKLPFHAAELHRQYGPVVRLSPNELIFWDPQAWKDIYGHRAPGQEEFSKDQRFYRPVGNMPTSIISADREMHGLIRRQLAHGFSDRSMREQAPIIGGYADLLIRRLRENTDGGKNTLNMREWLNWATFDIIGDLGFGDSFGCLEKSDYHPWVKIITKSIRTNTIMQGLTTIGLKPLVNLISSSGLSKARDQHRQLVRKKLQQRMELSVQRPDFIEGLIMKKDEWQMPFNQLVVNASTLIIAGSETTATLLSGAVFLLTTNLKVLKKLEHEVRSTFKEDSEITLTSVANLHYMLACLNECLRCYPPIAGGLPRTAPPGGGMVAGHFIPEGTSTAVWQWAISHNPSCWTDPMGFHPERFLGDPRFKGDQLDAMQPFHLGPRNCIGRNLAYAEMRLILAKIVYNFDMRIADESRDWLQDQRAYILWDKPALMCHLTPVTQ